ncbi:MAG TPA: hypothetical protein ENK18_26305 [Deltaproteobacteria bacterium]|nr:hypothetical protein [Deltaproteobacteria bacterium]
MRAWWCLSVVACGGAGSQQEPTWSGEIAPLLADRCGACHVEGGPTPFSVTSYEEALPWAEAIVDATQEGRMPPFFATSSDECDMQLGFLDDIRLSTSERQLLADWVEAGSPEGSRSSAAPAPLRTPDHLADPDRILSLPQPYEVSGQQDEYRCFRIELDNTEDRWITGLEVLPDNDAVVHHVLVWNDPGDRSAERVGPDGSYACSGQPDVWPTELVAAWTPGGSPTRAPVGAGTLFHPGASLVINVHYHPTGTSTELDQSRIALTWTDQQPAQHTTWYLVDLPFGAVSTDGLFEIPAGSEAHTETVALEVPTYIPWDLPVFAITPHMHYLGTEMLVTLRSPAGGEECLIHTPNYRFDFQTSYTYDPTSGPLPVVHPGDTIEVRCTYNNSESNPFLGLQLDASGTSSPQDIRWGEETGDEMCMAMVGLIIPPIDWMELAESLF